MVIVRYYRNRQHHPIRLLSRQFPEREDFEYGAAVGILALQLYYNLSYNELMLGGGYSGFMPDLKVETPLKKGTLQQ